MPAPPPAPTARTVAIGIMAKAPRAGRSKTRLCPPLAPDEASGLSAAFLRDTSGTLAAAARRVPIVPYAAYAPRDCEGLVAAHLAAGTRLVLADGSPPMPAGVEGFGRCLLHAIEAMLAEGHAAACVLSSDVPTLPADRLVEAAEHLLAPGDRGVFGACDDGGYYILGVKSAHARLFADIAWSTEAVAGATRTRAAEIGLDLVELAPWYDVDDAASLSRLRRECGGGDVAPATRAVLARLSQVPA